MPIPKKILNFLGKSKIKYKPIQHKTVYTAYDLAQTLKTKLSGVAKTLLIRADKDHALVVLPASQRLDLAKLKKFFKAKKIVIVKEQVMKKIFKVKPGTITPFGAIHKNISVYIDRTLTKTKKIIVKAGSHKDSIEMTGKNFLKATGGKLGSFGKKK